MIGNTRNPKSEKKETDLQQKSDDLSSHTATEGILRICSSTCQNTSSPQECLKQCFQKSPFYSLELSELHSQISEKLADSDLKHGFPPSFPPILEPFHSQEPTMADEIYNQDLMYI